ncbi:hypothetical protein CEXT_725451 [Caerostris extrusa]|uniref:Uncharacterized protein n=1 Tax=Caerostris extrusa TaxID=172846 RepID=A0AAV4YBJ4_CAEEX|nr:hypothetical protein CEXT_725451 [Caerostris extrusa]
MICCIDMLIRKRQIKARITDIFNFQQDEALPNCNGKLQITSTAKSFPKPWIDTQQTTICLLRAGQHEVLIHQAGSFFLWRYVRDGGLLSPPMH